MSARIPTVRFDPGTAIARNLYGYLPIGLKSFSCGSETNAVCVRCTGVSANITELSSSMDCMAMASIY